MSRLLFAWALAALLLPVPGHSAENARALVQKKAAIITSMHRKARKALVNAAQDKAFVEYFAAHDDGHRHAAKQKIDHISLKVQSRFHVEEMCLIDIGGAELSRIVGDTIADDLSPDESGADFFREAMALPPKQVLTSHIYLSPDADKWVIAFVTPVTDGERTKALLHYEHGLDHYQEVLNKDLSGDDVFLLATDESGRVISDSRAPVPVARAGDKEAVDQYFRTFGFNGQDLAAVKAAAGAGTPVTAPDGTPFEVAVAEAGHWTLLAFKARRP